MDTLKIWLLRALYCIYAFAGLHFVLSLLPIVGGAETDWPIWAARNIWVWIALVHWAVAAWRDQSRPASCSRARQ
jgi:hypothetical protein